MTRFWRGSEIVRGGVLNGLRINLSAVLVVAALVWIASSASAEAYNGLPDDLSGYRWQGSVSTSWDWSYDTEPYGGRDYGRYKGSMVYTGLRRLSTEDGSGRQNYTSHVEGRQNLQAFETCHADDPQQRPYPLYENADARVDGPYMPPEADGGELPTLRIRSSGKGFELFPDRLSLTPTALTSDCYPGTREGPGTAAAGLQTSQTADALLKQDTDPDPYHLVGTTTWSLEDPPMPLYEATTAYSFSATYDLRLVPIDACDHRFLAKDWNGYTALDEAGFSARADIAYGLAVKWCQPEGKPARDVSADIRLDADPGEGNLGAFGAVLNKFALDLQVKWKPSKRHDAQIELLPNGSTRVTAKTGHADLCLNVLGWVLGKGKLAFKRLPKRARALLVRKLLKKPLVAALGRKLRSRKERERLERNWAKLILKDRSKKWGSADPGPSSSVNKRKRALAKEVIRNDEEILDALAEKLALSFINLDFADVCVQVWEPKIVATLPTHGDATMQETGDSLYGLWVVREG